MQLLVTGATGFIGQHLVPVLRAAGHEVTLLLRRQPADGAASGQNAVVADLRDFAGTVRAVHEARPEGIVHLAAAGVTDPFLDPKQALAHNVSGTLHLLRAVFEEGTGERCLVARTPGERQAMNVYAASKVAAWNFCRMYARTRGWPIHGAMIFQAFGPGQPAHALVPAAFRAALAGQPFPISSGRQERDWIYVEDVIRGLLAALEAPLPAGLTVELGTGQITSVEGVVRQIYTVVGRGGGPLPGARPDRPGEASRQVADIEHNRQFFHWEATHSLAQGLQKLYRHHLAKAQ